MTILGKPLLEMIIRWYCFGLLLLQPNTNYYALSILSSFPSLLATTMQVILDCKQEQQHACMHACMQAARASEYRSVSASRNKSV